MKKLDKISGQQEKLEQATIRILLQPPTSIFQKYNEGSLGGSVNCVSDS